MCNKKRVKQPKTGTMTCNKTARNAETEDKRRIRYEEATSPEPPASKMQMFGENGATIHCGDAKEIQLINLVTFFNKEKGKKLVLLGSIKRKNVPAE